MQKVTTKLINIKMGSLEINSIIHRKDKYRFVSTSKHGETIAPSKNRTPKNLE
ncbi:MAG: hypothetical protein K2X81_07380 [Candidatus Obscuribacterales bacterium]|nr:hypothetical protein [Candidatus Obscuribacterales bacterium]